MSEWVDVALAKEFEPGTYRVVDADDVGIIVFNVDGEFYALEDVCTHDESELSGGCLDGDEVECPRHGARFCVKTGAALTPPAYESVSVLPVRIQDGLVQVRDDRWD